ncbi:unnamed protein product, partial [Aphanomyces euteiches]
WKGNVSKKDAPSQYRIVANAKSTGEPVGAKCEDAQREVKASISALPMVGESAVAFLIVHDPPNLEVYAKLMEAVHDVLSTAAIRVPKEGANAECTEAVGDARHQSVQLAPNEGTTAPRMGSRICQVQGCGRTDRGGGLCEIHRRHKVCSLPHCKRLAQRDPIHSIGRLCLAHQRAL